MLSVDKDQPAYPIMMTMKQRLSNSLLSQRMNMWLSGALGALALVLAAVGIYGVISFAVSQRTHEIGVRMALGAQEYNVLSIVVRQGMTLTMIGWSLGVILAVASTPIISSLLYGVTPMDPLASAGVSLVLIGVALLASYLPARRAARIDPMVALRDE